MDTQHFSCPVGRLPKQSFSDLRRLVSPRGGPEVSPLSDGQCHSTSGGVVFCFAGPNNVVNPQAPNCEKERCIPRQMPRNFGIKCCCDLHAGNTHNIVTSTTYFDACFITVRYGWLFIKIDINDGMLTMRATDEVLAMDSLDHTGVVALTAKNRTYSPSPGPLSPRPPVASRDRTIGNSIPSCFERAWETIRQLRHASLT